MSYLYYLWEEADTGMKFEYVFTYGEFGETLFDYDFDKWKEKVKKVYPLIEIKNIENDKYKIKTLSGKMKTVRKILKTQKPINTKLVFAFKSFGNQPDLYYGKTEAVNFCAFKE